MAVWTFYDYIEPGGRNPFREWQSGLPEGVDAYIDSRLLVMRALERWTDKWIKKYKGTDKIFELRIPHNRVQYRPLGTYAPGRSFVLLAGAIEKDWKIPSSIIDAAVEREKLLAKEPHHVREHQLY